MTAIDPALRKHVAITFAPLNRRAATNAFPPVASLSDALSKDLPAKEPGGRVVTVKPNVVAMFTTAAVEMWQRAVHSFLISSALTTVSPIWAAVSGYYSSHYSVRAAAHLLGYFQLFRRRRIVRLQMASGRYTCTFESKKGGDREHKFYWETVKAHPYFASDPFFTVNNAGIDASDVGHRDRASYADHLLRFPNFRPLNMSELAERIDHISKIEFDTPPIPRVSKCPDVESAQVIAYYRLVAFRKLVDEILGGSNRFWSVQRNPAWAPAVLKFQVTTAASMNSLGSSS
jgi:hypothetical protein